MPNKEHSLRPWSFKNRLIAALLLCSLISGFIAFCLAYTVSRMNVSSELAATEREMAINVLALDQKTELSDAEIARMAASESMTITIVEDDSHLTQDVLNALAASMMVTVSTRFTDTPVTYVQLADSVLRIRPVQDYSLVVAAALRILFGCLTFLTVFGLMATLASGKMAKPVTQLTAATRQVASGDFSIKLPDDAPGEVGELMRSFNGMTDALSRTSYLQKDFIGSISHEFRTPIASIGGFARLLQSPGLDEETRLDYVNMIAEESSRLSRLSETLLRLSSLEQQAAPAELSTFSLDEQVRQVILRLEPAWSSREIDWQLSLDPVTVTSDEALLTQVWINLIQNAVKFSPTGGSIEIRCYRTADAVVEITDHGIGMDESTVSRIFDRFFQADKSRSREGAGLGLCLVKRILDMLGGTIKVRSAPGEGSTFRVRLPDSTNGGKAS